METIETGRFDIYYKIPFINIYIGKDKYFDVYCFMYKDYDWKWGRFRWKVRMFATFKDIMNKNIKINKED